MNAKQIVNRLLSEELSVPDRHQKRVCLDTLRMHDAAANVAGGPDKDEARRILKDKFHYTDAQLARIENGKTEGDDDSFYDDSFFQADRLVRR